MIIIRWTSLRKVYYPFCIATRKLSVHCERTIKFINVHQVLHIFEPKPLKYQRKEILPMLSPILFAIDVPVP